LDIKKPLALAVILLFISVSVIPSSGTNVVEKSSNVSFDGNNLYVGGNGTGNYTRIQDAIDNASDGDTVFVYDDSAPYYENVVVDKSINLIGEDRNTTVIDGGGSGDVVRISADWIYISEFTIRNSGGNQDYPDFDAGIDIRSNYNTIICNSISNSIVCIYLKSCSNNIITGNSISGNNYSGIYLYDSRRNTITDNNISDNFFGIHHFKSSSNNIIKGNIISNNGGGIHFESSSSNNITGNKFTSNHLSILFWGSSSNIITSNDILNSGGEGILLFLSNKNIIEKNNFIGNRIHAIFYISWRNNWDGNYWDKWIGFGPKPIFGLLGLTGKIPWINFDWRPALEPYDIP